MKTVIVFPGYGSQYLGMGKKLYDDERVVQEFFEDASSCLNQNFVKLCFASSQEQLAKITNAYTTLLLLGYATYQLLKQEGVESQLMVGETIGAYTAFACAGAFSFPDALFLINQYAQLYEELLKNNDMAMISVIGGDAPMVEALCKKASNEEFGAHLAIVRAPRNMVISGHAPAIDKLKQLLDDEDDLSYQDEDCGLELHSTVMQPIVDALKPQLNLIDIKNASVPVLHAVNGSIITTREEVTQALLDRIVKPIDMTFFNKMAKDFDLIIQVGPGNDIAQALMKEYPRKWIFSVNERSDINEIKKYIQLGLQQRNQ